MVPNGEHLPFGEEKFLEYEERGVKEACKAAFVLVAGGLGERLGYNGIKIALPSESTTGTCFLHLYIKSILALQSASIEANEGAKDNCRIPLVIMTSDDTHAKTQQLLSENNYFGMHNDQVVLLKQEKVACFQDNDARLALDPSDKYTIQTKPHGHGDVHTLLFQSGLLPIWPFVGDVPEDMVSEEELEVEELDKILIPEQILAHKERKVRGKVARRYLVKFKNYSPMDAKWMEEAELVDSPQLLQL
ncbi:hypothetical protein L7F22_032278 [Adiantum nelumboides]|nr:hypothetical protein [Adiantum nelumboides]